jgi:hypothetical protein
LIDHRLITKGGMAFLRVDCAFAWDATQHERPMELHGLIGRRGAIQGPCYEQCRRFRLICMTKRAALVEIAANFVGIGSALFREELGMVGGKEE